MVILTRALHPDTYNTGSEIGDAELQRIEAAKEEAYDLIQWLGKTFYFRAVNTKTLHFWDDIVTRYLTDQVRALLTAKHDADRQEIKPFCKGFTYTALYNAVKTACAPRFSVGPKTVAGFRSTTYAWQGPKFCVVTLSSSQGT